MPSALACDASADAVPGDAGPSSGSARLHVFDELRCGLGLRKHSHAVLASKKRRIADPAPLFFPSTKGWRDMAPPKPSSAWARGPVQVLEALVGAPANSLDASRYTGGASACGEAEAELRLLHAATLAEGGLLPTARSIAAKLGRELEPADLTDAAERLEGEGRLAPAAAVMAALLVEGRAEDDSPQRRALVESVTELIAQLTAAPWPAGVAVGGRRL